MKLDQGKSRAKTLKGWLLVAVLFIVIPYAGLAVLWRDACVTSRVSETMSPNGDFAAGVYLTDCKGRLQPATDIRIEARRTPVAQDVVKSVLLYQGAEAPELVWSGERALKIIYPKGVAVVRRQPEYPDLTIDLTESL